MGGRLTGRRISGGDTGKPELPLAGPILKQHGGIAVLLVLQQAADELLADRLHRLFRLLGTGHEFPGLDLQEHAGQFNELTHLIDRDILDHVDVGDELLGNFCQGHLRDVHLVSLHEIEQQIHRSGEDIEGDLEFHARASHQANGTGPRKYLPCPPATCQWRLPACEISAFCRPVLQRVGFG